MTAAIHAIRSDNTAGRSWSFLYGRIREGNKRTLREISTVLSSFLDHPTTEGRYDHELLMKHAGARERHRREEPYTRWGRKGVTRSNIQDKLFDYLTKTTSSEADTETIYFQFLNRTENMLRVVGYLQKGIPVHLLPEVDKEDTALFFEELKTPPRDRFSVLRR